MERSYRTKKETIEYFKTLSYEFSKQAHREEDPTAKARLSGKAEAYELAAFELENNMN